MPNPLEWLGAYMPKVSDLPPATARQRRMEEERKTQQRAAMPQWKKDLGTLGDIAINNPITNLIKGMSPIGASERRPEDPMRAEDWGELIGAATDLFPAKMAASKVLSLAGMPLAAYRRMGKIKGGLHRVQKGDYDIIDDARIAGREGGNVHGPGVYTFGNRPQAERFHETMQEEGMPTVGRIRELDASAQNVLDLVEPDPRDIHKYLKTYPENIQEVHREYFNNLMSQGRTSDEAYKELAKIMANAPSGNVQGMTEQGFDALRYPYGGESAWMFPTSTPIHSVDRTTGRIKRTPFNQAALNERQKSIGAQPQISVTPEATAGPKAGDILPSGRRFAEKTEAAPKPRPHPTSFRPPQTRMSIAELMAQSSGPKMRKVKLPNGKIIDVTEEEFLKMRGSRGGG